MAVVGPLLVFVVTLWIYYLWSQRRYYKFAFKMRGPWGLPFLGLAYKMFNLEDLLYELPNITEEYKSKTIFTWLGPFPVVYTTEPKIVEVALNSPDSIEKSILYQVINEAVGSGLLTSRANKWYKHRRLINPCFNHKILLSFFPHFNKYARQLYETFEMHANCGEVNVKVLVSNMALRNSVESTMGVDFGNTPDNKFLECLEKLLNLTAQRVLKPWLRSTTLLRLTSMYKTFIESRSYVSKFVYDLVKEKAENPKKDTVDPNNNPTELLKNSVDITKTKHIFIDQAIKIHQTGQFTFDDIVNEANLMVFAAYDTTATELYSVFTFLAMHPEVQERLYDEIVTVFPEKEFEVNFENLQDLAYLDMCVNETMRLAPAIPIIARSCTKDIPISDDLVIPSGTQIVMDVFNMHRDKDVWGPDAMNFNPDHFLPSNMADVPRYSYIPYSKGVRNCIGWQLAGFFLRVAVAQVVRRYKFSTKFQFEDLRFMEHITLNYKVAPQLEILKR